MGAEFFGPFLLSLVGVKSLARKLVLTCWTSTVSGREGVESDSWMLVRCSDRWWVEGSVVMQVNSVTTTGFCIRIEGNSSVLKQAEDHCCQVSKGRMYYNGTELGKATRPEDTSQTLEFKFSSVQKGVC